MLSLAQKMKLLLWIDIYVYHLCNSVSMYLVSMYFSVSICPSVSISIYICIMLRERERESERERNKERRKK
jgi:hypothetical protein